MVVKIGLYGYIQYESHLVISFSVRRFQRYLGFLEATNKNSGNKYYNWVKLNNTGPSNRDRALLGLIPRL